MKKNFLEIITDKGYGSGKYSIYEKKWICLDDIITVSSYYPDRKNEELIVHLPHDIDIKLCNSEKHQRESIQVIKEYLKKNSVTFIENNSL